MLIAQEHKNRQGQNKKSNKLAFSLSHQELGKHHQQSLQLRKLLIQTESVQMLGFSPFTCLQEEPKLCFIHQSFQVLLSINYNI